MLLRKWSEQEHFLVLMIRALPELHGRARNPYFRERRANKPSLGVDNVITSRGTSGRTPAECVRVPAAFELG